MSTSVEASRAVATLPGLATASSPARRRVAAPVLMMLPALGLVSIIFLVPLAYMAWLSVTDPTTGLGNYEKLFESPAYLKVSWLTVRTALLVTLFSLVLAYPVAYQLSKARPRLANLLLIAVVVPYFVSFLIRTYAWMVILGREGVINSLLQQVGVIEKPLRLMFNTLGVYTGMLNVMTPIMILVLYGVMRGLDRTLVRAARSLGATPLQAFVRIFLPLSMPGVGSASLLVFILSLGFYITPALLGSDRDIMASSLIVAQVNELFNWGMASTLSLVLLAFVGLTYWLLRSVAGVEQAIGSGGPFGVPATRPKRSDGRATLTSQAGDAIRNLLTPVGLALERGLNHLRRPDWAPRWCSMNTLLWVFTGIVLFYLIVPVLIVIPLSFSSAKYLTFPPPGFSFQWYEAYFHDEAWVDATLFSIRVGLLTSALALILGLLATVALVRFNLRGRRLMFILLILPIVVPEIITAVAIYFVFARAQFVASLPSIAIAQTVLAVPYVMLVVAPALRGLDPQFEQAARNLGASPARTFWHITFPLLRPSIIAAALFAFLASFDNLLIALFLSGPSAITLPIKMWQGLRLEINPLISAVSTLEIVIAITILLLAGQYRSRRA